VKNIPHFYHRLRVSLIAATLTVGLLTGAEASVIGVTSSTSHVGIGQSFAVSFDIQGLTGAANSSLSSFDLDVLYDAALLRLIGVNFSDPATGRNQLDFSEAGGFGFLGGAQSKGGRIDLFGLSGNSAGVLDAVQADVFRFASLTFEALAPAPLTTIAIDLNDTSMLFIDSGASMLATGFGNTSANIDIGVAAIPEPSTLLLVLMGALAFGLHYRRRNAAPPIAAAILAFGLATGAHAAPASETPAPTKSTATPSQQEAISGVITAVVGQRMQIRSNSGAQRWYTTAIPLEPGHVGKRVSGVAAAAGDGQVLLRPSFSN
jgi:hypothetical protein